MHPDTLRMRERKGPQRFPFIDAAQIIYDHVGMLYLHPVFVLSERVGTPLPEPLAECLRYPFDKEVGAKLFANKQPELYQGKFRRFPIQ